MKFDDLLGVVFFVADVVALLVNFLYDAGVEFAVAWVDGFAVIALLKEGGVGLFEDF